MKRALLFSLGLGLALTLLLSACQKSPSEPIVIQKNQDDMIKAATSPDEEPEALPIGERIEAPEHYQCELNGDSIKIGIDADVVIPDLTTVPMFRVEAANFSQDQISTYFRELCGEATMWIVPSELTKADVESEIIRAKNGLAVAQDENDEAMTELYEARLATYQALYASAPDSIEEKRSDGTLSEIAETNPSTGEVVGHYTGIHAVEKLGDRLFGREINVHNNSDRKESIVFAESTSGGGGLGVQLGARVVFNSGTGILPLMYSDVQGLDIDSISEDKLVPNVTVETAKNLVQQVLSQTQTPMKINRITVMRKEDADDAVDAAAYKIECNRIISNFPCAVIDGSAVENSTEMYAPLWFYEHCTFWVNGNGIVGMIWESPLEILDTVVSNCSLMSFDAIKNVISSMLPIMFDYQAKATAATTTELNISKICLELVRITEKNSLNTGLLIPAWRLYGSKSVHAADGGVETTSGCYLTLNAIDGSVIDTTVGY